MVAQVDIQVHLHGQPLPTFARQLDDDIYALELGAHIAMYDTADVLRVTLQDALVALDDTEAEAGDG